MSHTSNLPVEAGLPWKNHSTRTSEKKPFLNILMWECGGFVSLPVWLMNPDMKKYWIKCWPSSGVPSLANFLSGSLILYSFFTMAQLKQKECKESYRMGVMLAAMNSSHSEWGWCRNVYFIPRQVCCCASYCTGLPSCLPSLPSFLPLFVGCLP